MYPAIFIAWKSFENYSLTCPYIFWRYSIRITRITRFSFLCLLFNVYVVTVEAFSLFFDFFLLPT